MSRHVFQIGEKARIIKVDRYPEFLGDIVTVTSQRHRYAGVMAYRVDVVHPDLGGESLIRAEYLVPINDGHEKVEWSDCAWRPTVMSEDKAE